MAGAVPTLAAPDGLDSISKILQVLGTSLGGGKTTSTESKGSSVQTQSAQVSPEANQQLNDLLAKITSDSNSGDIDNMVKNILDQAKTAFGDTAIGANAAGVRAYSDTSLKQLRDNAMAKAVAAAAAAKLDAISKANSTAAGLVESKLANTRTITSTTQSTSPDTKTSQTGASTLGKISAAAGIAAAANGLFRKGGILAKYNPFDTAGLPDASTAPGDYYGEDSLLNTGNDVGLGGGGGGLSLSGGGSSLSNFDSFIGADAIPTVGDLPVDPQLAGLTEATSSAAEIAPEMAAGTSEFTNAAPGGEFVPSEATLNITDVNPEALSSITNASQATAISPVPPTGLDLSTPVNQLDMSPTGIGSGLPDSAFTSGGTATSPAMTADTQEFLDTLHSDSVNTINRLAGEQTASAATGTTTDVTPGLLDSVPELSGSNVMDISGGLDGAASSGAEAAGSVAGASSAFIYPLTFALGDMLGSNAEVAKNKAQVQAGIQQYGGGDAYAKYTAANLQTGGEDYIDPNSQTLDVNGDKYSLNTIAQIHAHGLEGSLSQDVRDAYSDYQTASSNASSLFVDSTNAGG